ncbi:MAG: phosphate ABC transporter substrate-binding protein PstS [Miltoncostaeaceae bacterium]
MNRTLRIAAAAAVGAGTLVGAASALGASTGSGATFPAIAYTKWCGDSGLCSYTGKGSGAGIKDLTKKTVDWAGSDAPLTPEELAAIGGQVKYFPTLLGAITIPVNVPGVTGSKVNFDGTVLQGIFDGSIKAWNDKKITAINKGVKFPASPITVCVRADSSGTSFVFSRYLGKTNGRSAFKGGSKTPPWSAPVLVRQPGNPGVAQCVANTPNSIGYVDFGDAIRAGLQSKIAKVGKKGGPYVGPSTSAIVKAGEGKASTIKPDLTVDFSASPNKGAYPIVATTWALVVPGRPTNAGALQAIKYFLSPAAQKVLPGLGFAPLPAGLWTLANKQLSAA